MSTLATKDLTIRFGGHVAVNGVTCSFEPGTLTAIVGPNGAGKTTYFNLISGQLKASSGSVTLGGQDLTGQSVSARTHAGLGRAFQLTNLFPNLSVLENVRLAVQATQEGKHRRGLNLWSIWSDHSALTQRARVILQAVAMTDRADTPVASLPHGDQRKLEVALLMALEPQVYMFDEPTAGMSHDEAPVILNLIRELKKDKTKIILLVEHKMDVVRELADRIIVLTQRHAGGRWPTGRGDCIARGARGLPGCEPRRPHEHQQHNPSQPARTQGRAHAHRCVPHPARGGSGRAQGPAHHAAGPQRRGQDHHAAHHHGPVAGVAGLHPLRWQDITAMNTPAIAGLNIAYVPENMGIFADLTVKENMLLAARSARNATQMDEARLQWIFKLFPAVEKFWNHPAGKLSGGQKQMLAVSRAIVEPRDLLIVDEPSKGLAPAIINNMIEAFEQLKKPAA